ncbi:MAG: SAM-dependent methyltransferase [Nitrospinae bacterium]|nr:SAM-dependent methyltransferase [Nitrospinota bacterium]
MDINEVGSTAFFPSCVRQMEQDEARPLFGDPFAAWFIDEEATAKFRDLIRTFPAIRETARYRVCIMNETLERATADGVKQVVTLGAGFDMRAHIFGADGVRFCDVDQPGVLAFKRKVLEAHGVAPCAAIPGNYLEFDLSGELSQAGFDLEAPTLFIWEGNTMYLPLDLVHDFLERLRARIPRLIVAFDYFSEHIINRTSGNETMTATSDYFENHFGAKWVTGFDDLSVFERRNQLRIIRSGAMLDVCKRYAPERAPALAEWTGLHSYCVLKAS